MSVKHIRMTTIEQRSTIRERVMWLAVALAVIAAVSYILIGFNMLAVGDLQTGERPATIIYVAASCYLVGGLLILLRRRWLWLVGVGINAMVMLFFFSSYLDRPAVLFSPGGLVTKAAQLLLEASLIYLIIANWRRSQGGARS